jgi:hypothetical protein
MHAANPAAHNKTAVTIRDEKNVVTHNQTVNVARGPLL